MSLAHGHGMACLLSESVPADAHVTVVDAPAFLRGSLSIGGGERGLGRKNTNHINRPTYLHIGTANKKAAERARRLRNIRFDQLRVFIGSASRN
jgi:hypothetical protein